ncbi:trehalose-phosphatase [Phenylobacterium sp.]|uniref:trehalose-phosphatase n=1 Tax=Phenylobacterium sp. TaxID=1871053 RepID=UPI002ED7DDCA
MASLPLAEASLFLDLDGTLAPLCDSPGDVRPLAERTSLLRLAGERLAGRLAIVSGRTIESVDAISEGACAAVAGVHGLQRRTAFGGLETTAPHPRVEHAAALMAAFAQGHPGLLVEHKDQSAALHYRGAPNAEPAVMEFVQRLAETEALEVQPGHLVMEVRTPGPDKGAAVRAFLSEVPFRGSTPIYLGDDLTDEPAFAEVAARGGVGILVGRERPTAARARLEDPSEVLAWLAESLQRGAFKLGRAFSWAA